MEPSRAVRLFRVLLLAYLAYAAIYIYRTSFVINGERYFCLFDDAMVSMRYARNLVHGYGLVYNPGAARVEGYTNPGWVLYMALLHLLPVAASKASLQIQITGALLLAANLFVVRRIALHISNSEPAALGACALTAFYLPLNMWTLQGMEVGALTLILSVATLRVLRSLKDQKLDLWPLVLLALSTLVRMDMAVTFAGLLLFQWFHFPQHRKRLLTVSILLMAVFAGGQTWFRHMYYGEILPNTYYLKMTGMPLWMRWTAGFYALIMFTWKSNWLLILLPFTVLYFLRGKQQLLLAWLFVVQAAYSVFVGGDSWEGYGGSNRFIAIAMPEFLVLFCWSVLEVCRRYWQAGLRRFAFLMIFAWLAFNSIYGPIALLEASFILPPAHAGDNQAMVTRALIIREITKSDAKVAVTWAGALPYFADRYTVDILGKTDPYVAHLPIRWKNSLLETIATHQPGHMKYDYEHSLDKLQPDVVSQLWKGQEEAYPILQKTSLQVTLKGYLMFLRNGSTKVLWGKLASFQ